MGISKAAVDIAASSITTNRVIQNGTIGQNASSKLEIEQKASTFFSMLEGRIFHQAGMRGGAKRTKWARLIQSRIHMPANPVKVEIVKFSPFEKFTILPWQRNQTQLVRGLDSRCHGWTYPLSTSP